MKFTLETDRAYYVWDQENTNRIVVWAGQPALEQRETLNGMEQRIWDAFPEVERSDLLPHDAEYVVKTIERQKPQPLAEINLYDYAKGEPRISTREEFERECHEWEDALDEREFQKLFENN